MSESFKIIVMLLALMMGISAAQLIRLSFFPHTASYQLSPEQQRQDIRQLLAAINQKSAFAAFDPSRKHAFNQQAQLLLNTNLAATNAAAFQMRLQRWVSSLNDPAITVSLPVRVQLLADVKQLPGQLQYDGRHWLVYTAKNRPFDEDFPYLTHIDGLPMQRWEKAAQLYIPDSIKLSAKEQSHWLRRINRLKLAIGLTISNNIVLTLSNPEGNSIQRKLALVSKNQQRDYIHPLTASTQAVQSSSIEQHVIRYPVDNEFAPMILEQLASSNPEQDLLLDIRHLATADTALTQWLQSQFAPQYSAYNRAIGLIKYKRYPHATATSFVNQHFEPIERLHFFEQVNLEMLGFNNQIQDSPSFSHWLVRSSNNTSSNDKLNSRKLNLLVDSSCQQECEWLALMASAWPNVQLVGERTRGSPSPRHYITLIQSGIKLSFSAGLTYSAQGKLVSGIGIPPTIRLTNLALSQESIKQLIAAKSGVPTHTSSVNTLSTAKRSP
ncbi:S41 family peptidase [Shewanella abyssi]|uniref:S41 family peptidase n=1 Tax=Shewanella abyssi TaxID=311789 RepID=UPI00200E6D51|nr:S41 family peptidase [Shewanella abyssi]MCL1049608.1 S41 family peptidase [Shewanella abyssi]